MQTISAEEFKKRYGTQGETLFGQPTQPAQPSFFDRLKQTASGGLSKVKEGFSQIAGSPSKPVSGNPLDLVSGVGKIGSGLVDAVTSPITAAIAPVTKPIGDVIQKSAEGYASLPIVQKFANTKVGQGTARLAEDVSNYSNVAGAVGGAMEVPKVGSAIKTGATDIAETGLNKAKSAIFTVKEKINPTVDLPTQTLKDATPSYSKKLISESPVKNVDGTLTPRVQEGGLIKGRTVTPNKFEIEASTELAKVKNYPVNGTNLEKYQSIQPEITARSQNLTESLKNENILRPPQQISKVVSNAINKVPEESLLLQKSDPLISNYMRVVDNAIAKADGTLAGELKVRQLLDAAYKNARGKMAFGSDKLSALDDIHTAARDALNADIIAKAKNVDVKASLKAQWDLMRASDVLRNKAEGEAGNAVGRFQQKHPIATKLGKGISRVAGTATGVGTVIH